MEGEPVVGEVAGEPAETGADTRDGQRGGYVVVPLIVLFAPRRHLVKILLVAITAAVAYRAGALAAGSTTGTPSVPTVACLDSLGLGALLAVTRHRGVGDRWTRWALAAGVLLLAVSLAAAQLFDHGFGTSSHLLRHVYKGMLDTQTVTQDTAVALISVWLVAGASRGFRGLLGKTLSLPPLVYLGTISYGIYLYHYFAIWVFQEEFGWIRKHYPDQAVYCVTLTAATVVVASISWFALERPVNGLKRHFPYARPRKAPAGAPAVPEDQLALEPS